jgi:plasmanylethanolamine desaturase
MMVPAPPDQANRGSHRGGAADGSHHQDSIAEAELLAESYTEGWRRLEVVAISALILACTAAMIRVGLVVERLDSVDALIALTTAFVTGWVGADLCSGLVHWAADNWGTPNTPFVGAGFIRPFRHHHLDPSEMCNHDFVELNGNLAIVALPVIVAATFINLPWGPEFELFAVFSIVSLVLWVCCTQQIHSWSHQETPPRYALLLQRAHLIMGSDHHDVHHVAPHRANYCITTGWLNPILGKLKFFEGLEWLISTMTGIRPYHEVVARKLDAATHERGLDDNCARPKDE